MVVAAIAVAVCGLLVGCSPCGRVYDAWTDTLRVEVAHVGIGDLADTGIDDHVRWIFGDEVIGLLVAPIDESAIFAPSSGAVTLDAAETGADAARVDLALRVVPRRVQAVADAGGPALVIAFDLDAIGSSLRYRTPREDVTWAVEGAMEIVVPLAAEARNDGVDVILRVGDARVRTAGLDLDRLRAQPEPPTEAAVDAASALAESLVVDMLDDAPDRVELLSVPALVIGGVPLQGVPSRFAVTDTGSLVVGLVTPLRPTGDLAAMPSLIHGAPFAVELHPGLPLAAIRADLVDGTIPRRRAPDGQGATGGRFGVSVDAVTLRGTGITWSFRWWCLAGERCYRADLVGQGTVGLDAAGLVVAPGPSVVRGVSPPHASVTPDAAGVFVARMSERIDDLLTPGRVRVLDRWRFEPRVEELAAGADRLRVAGTIELSRVDLLRSGGR